jgi:hypothetical protein
VFVSASQYLAANACSRALRGDRPAGRTPRERLRLRPAQRRATPPQGAQPWGAAAVVVEQFASAAALLVDVAAMIEG